jgi:hypothetical protein
MRQTGVVAALLRDAHLQAGTTERGKSTGGRVRDTQPPGCMPP